LTKDIFLNAIKLLEAKGITKIEDLLILYGLRNEFLNKNEQPKISLIKENTACQRPLQIRYVSFDNNLQIIKVSPQEVIEEGGKNYLLAVSMISNKEIKLNLNRVLDAKII
jgi:hypothetical protein